MKLLCVADVHLGRVPARLPPELAERAAELGAAAAWRRAVDLALEKRVSAVLLAGDLVDGSNDFFEAFSALRDGAVRLAAAGIQVVAVAGNHDTEVLARLAQAVPQVRLLGVGGRWEAVDVRSASGNEFVRVLGWSFPERWFGRSPLEGSGLTDALAAVDGYGAHGVGAAAAAHAVSTGDAREVRPPASQRLATLGLLHADRDQSGSRYAPVASAQLYSAPVDAWVMGHVHEPDVSAQLRAWGRGGYLGSLAACDPSETGPRGAWLFEVGRGGAVSMQHVPLAPLRWENLEIDVSGLSQAEEVSVLLTSGLEQLVESLGGERSALGCRPTAVGCRVSLIGRSPFRSQIEAVLEAEAVTAVSTLFDDVEVFVHRVRLEVLPAIDLHDLAGNQDPVGLLAQRVLALKDQDSELRRRLVTQARPEIEAVERLPWAKGAQSPPLTDDDVAQLLEEAALRALDALLQQNPEAARGVQTL